MNEVDFVAKREPEWQQLAQQCDRAEVSFKSLTGDELIQFVKLYRRASSDLARIRTASGNLELIQFLNSLVNRAYCVIYRRKRTRAMEALDAILYAGASAVRRRYKAILVSLFVFSFGMFFAATVITTRPDLETRFIDRNDPNIKGWLSGQFEQRSADEAVMMHAFYASNNPRVARIAAAVSVSTFGLGTTYLLIQNGQLIGSLGTLMAQNGNLGHLVVSVAPHGASELTGAVIAGGAGYVMGGALIAPGRRRRGDALRIAGKDAFILIVLSMLMMLIAAPFEGYFSFNPAVPDILKAVVAVVVLVAWMAYFMGYQKERDQIEALNAA